VSKSVSTSSMLPTIDCPSEVIINPLSYLSGIEKSVKRGDIIVFRNTLDRSVLFVKRVIGLPGDTVCINEKILSVNNVKVAERVPSFIEEAYNSKYQSNVMIFTEYLGFNKYFVVYDTNIKYPNYCTIVPEGKYFVLGDNRTNSLDSSKIGFILSNQIYCKVISTKNRMSSIN
jgi:signal peptidase I